METTIELGWNYFLVVNVTPALLQSNRVKRLRTLHKAVDNSLTVNRLRSRY